MAGLAAQEIAHDLWEYADLLQFSRSTLFHTDDESSTVDEGRLTAGAEELLDQPSSTRIIIAFLKLPVPHFLLGFCPAMFRDNHTIQLGDVFLCKRLHSGPFVLQPLRE